MKQWGDLLKSKQVEVQLWAIVAMVEVLLKEHIVTVFVSFDLLLDGDIVGNGLD